MRILISVSLLVLQVFTVQVQATGLNFWESSTLNSALASANGAIANDASVIALAPSSMSQLTDPTISASVTYYDVTTDYSIFGIKTQYNTANPIPMGFFVSPINDDFSFGLAIYSRTAADITVPSIPLVHPKETRVTPITVSVSPSVAYKVGNFSFALSLEYIYAQYALEQTSCVVNFCNMFIQEDTTQGWSGALSGTWQVSPYISVALIHRLSTQFGDENIDIEIPTITSLYGSFVLSQNTTLHTTYSYTQSNGTGITYIDYNDPIGLLIGYKNSQRFASSLEHQFGNWTLRGGISFDQAIDQFGGLDKRYRLGVGYKVNKNLVIDVAMVNEDYARKEALAGDITLVQVQNSGTALSVGASYKF